MKVRIISILFSLIYTILTQGQTNDAKALYKNAFNEYIQMLKGQTPFNFKRAVFLSENAFNKGALNYQDFCTGISETGKLLKQLIKERGLEQYKTAGNWAVFAYMSDSLPINKYKPCTYDFVDFMGEKDWSKMFVIKLMKTKSGNCHSLPYYYKILCEEIGAKASLALAPNHIYIKHIDEKGQWTNVELTNGGFPRDQWIIKQMAISVEAIKNEIYMNPLTDKECIALAMFDLSSAYKYQYGNDDFVLSVCDSALKYFPKCIPLLMSKANCLQDMIEAEKKAISPDKVSINRNLAIYKETINKIDSLGHKDMPVELYQAWVSSVEEEKIKRGIVTK